MAKLLDDLLADHAGMSRLLDLLETELAVFGRGDDPDYGLIVDVLDYCRVYPDRYHHPKEELLLAALAARAPAEARAAMALTQEHERLAELTRRFAEATDLVTGDQELPRDGFALAARGFIDFYRQHLAWEERELFPRARRALGADDWQALEARLEQAPDPLVNGEARFKALRQALVSEA